MSDIPQDRWNGYRPTQTHQLHIWSGMDCVSAGVPATEVGQWFKGIGGPKAFIDINGDIAFLRDDVLDWVRKHLCKPMSEIMRRPAK
jgi:hypothetical protein